MDKVKLEFKIPENKVIEYNGTKIEIIPFMGVAEQIALINRYIEQYFTKTDNSLIVSSRYDYLNAEYNLMNYIFQTYTNIETEGLSEDIFADNALWNEIISNMVNYEDFRNKLAYIIHEIKQQEILENSLGTVISGLVEKAYGLLNKITDISPEELEKTRAASMDLLDKLEKSSILSNIPVKKD